MKALLLRMFGQPKGVLGRLGGIIMARMNRAFAHTLVRAIPLRTDSRVLEIGFGPGVAIERLTELVASGSIAGVDPSSEMVEQARRRNADGIKRGLVELRQASVEGLPFSDSSFDLTFAINSMQVWPDVPAALRQIHRVLRPGGQVALGFTPYSGRSRSGLVESLAAAGFVNARIQDLEGGFCAIANKP